jgi:hypothetical protein
MALDAIYLKENVGEALAQGLTAVLVAQPEDSVEYLGKWLIKFVESQEKQTKVTFILERECFAHVLHPRVFDSRGVSWTRRMSLSLLCSACIVCVSFLHRPRSRRNS